MIWSARWKVICAHDTMTYIYIHLYLFHNDCQQGTGIRQVGSLIWSWWIYHQIHFWQAWGTLTQRLPSQQTLGIILLSDIEVMLRVCGDRSLLFISYKLYHVASLYTIHQFRRAWWRLRCLRLKYIAFRGTNVRINFSPLCSIWKLDLLLLLRPVSSKMSFWLVCLHQKKLEVSWRLKVYI